MPDVMVANRNAKHSALLETQGGDSLRQLPSRAFLLFSARIVIYCLLPTHAYQPRCRNGCKVLGAAPRWYAYGTYVLQ